jgi:hypothetical protein
MRPVLPGLSTLYPDLGVNYRCSSVVG